MLVMAVGIELADEGLVRALVGGLIVGKVLVDVVTHDGEEHGIILIFAAQSPTDFAAHLFYPSLGERHVTEVLAHVHLDSVIFKGQRAHLQLAHPHVFGQFTSNNTLHGILLLLIENLGMSRQNDSHRSQHTQQYLT